jgi:hypothetical protein
VKGKSKRVYAIRAGKTAFVKIGDSRDPRRRRKQLQTSHYRRLILLGVFPERYGTERDVHAMLSAYHVRGEWYRIDGRLSEMLAELEDAPPESETISVHVRMTEGEAARLDAKVRALGAARPGVPATRPVVLLELALRALAAEEAAS